MPKPSVPREPAPDALEGPQAGFATHDTPGAENGAPDLTTDRLDAIRARAVQGYAPTMRDTLTLVAEVERLRAESVPRSALVQVGWYCGVTHRPDETGRGTVTGSLAFIEEDRCCAEGYQPVYVIREDTDA